MTREFESSLMSAQGIRVPPENPRGLPVLGPYTYQLVSLLLGTSAETPIPLKDLACGVYPDEITRTSLVKTSSIIQTAKATLRPEGWTIINCSLPHQPGVYYLARRNGDLSPEELAAAYDKLRNLVEISRVSHALTTKEPIPEPHKPIETFIRPEVLPQIGIGLTRIILSSLAFRNFAYFSVNLLEVFTTSLPSSEDLRSILVRKRINHDRVETEFLALLETVEFKTFVVDLFIRTLSQFWEPINGNSCRPQVERDILNHCTLIRGRGIDMAMVTREVCRHFSVAIPQQYNDESLDPEQQTKEHFLFTL